MTTKQVLQKLEKAHNIAIFSHRAPDPDAYGSMFGMLGFCRQIGKNADVFLKDKTETNLSKIFPIDEAKTEFDEKQYDLVVVVDLHILERVDECFQEKIKNFKNKVVIDHHAVGSDAEMFTKSARISPVAAASMIVVDLFRTAEIMPKKETATHLYAGIMGDTDRFLHTNLSKQVFEDAIFLFESGAQVQHIYDYMYRYTTPEEIRVNKAIYNRMKYLCDGRALYVIFTEKDCKKMHVNNEDIKQFSNTLINIKGVELALLIYQLEKGVFKFSIRSSKANLVPHVAKMGGGGHPCAAGFDFHGNVLQAKRLVKKFCEDVFNG